ncbi:unnamed protein product [Closterium sp. NIES-53]
MAAHELRWLTFLLTNLVGGTDTGGAGSRGARVGGACFGGVGARGAAAAQLHPSIILLPPSSFLTASSLPLTYYYHTTHPDVSRVLSSFIMDPTTSPSSVSTFVADAIDFAATLLVAAPLACPLSARGESALGYEVLEDRKFEPGFLAAPSPHLFVVLLTLDGDSDPPHIPTSHT